MIGIIVLTFVFGMVVGMVIQRIVDIRHSKNVANARKEIKNKPFLKSAYRLPNKPWWHIQFHEDGEIPKGGERIFPKPHPGGKPKGTGLYEHDPDSRTLILEDDRTFEQAWEVMRPKYFPDDKWKKLSRDQQSDEFDVWQRRIKRQIETNNS